MEQDDLAGDLHSSIGSLKVILPMLDKVRALTRSASTEKSIDPALLVHHSRDTEAKQWTETSIQTLQAVAKIFNVQRAELVKLGLISSLWNAIFEEDFAAAWEQLLQCVEWSASTENVELSLAALKSFQELLLGRVSVQTLDMNTRDRSASNAAGDEVIPFLPPKLWVVSWKVCFTIL